MPNLRSFPPKTGLRYRLSCSQRPLKPPWIGHYVDELGQDLGCESQRDLGLEDLALEKSVSRLVCRQLD